MVIAIDGQTTVIQACPHCGHGRFVKDRTGKILGHYQRGSVYNRSGYVVEASALCPGPGNRAFGGSVVGPTRAAARMKAIRRILSWQA